MQILINGADYTEAITAEGPITLQRILNAPSRCKAEILVDATTLPQRKARVVVNSVSDGTVLFTGYLATEPVKVIAGKGSEGNVYRARITAVSDEWLLDKLGSSETRIQANLLSQSAGNMLAQLASRLSATSLQVATGNDARVAGIYSAGAAKVWSANASIAAGAAYAGYRALAGQVLVQPAGAVTHSFSEENGTLQINELALSHVRELTNDVTLSGMQEPAAYVTECFTGDGTTAIFNLQNAAFRPSQRAWLSDRFEAANFDTTQWKVSDPSGMLSLTGAGLTFQAATSIPNGTSLSALDTLELGGRVVIEMAGVVLGAGSDGILSGIYEGAIALSSCFAGFRVRQQSAQTVLVPVLNGNEVGNLFTPLQGHSYTLRLRIDCNEMYRLRQRYYSMVDGVVEGFGDTSGIDAAVNVVFELLDEGVASSTPATVLYDSFAAALPVSEAPSTGIFALVDSTSMAGSVGAVRVLQDGPMWITSVTATGARSTRLLGGAGEGVDAEVSYGTAAGTNGSITFYAGRIPEANERLSVSYRKTQRAVARVADMASVADETNSGIQGTSRWLGQVLEPVARSSEDCEAAARAILAFSSSRSAAIAGTFDCINPQQDLWPGDVMALTSENDVVKVLIRSVTIIDGASLPETCQYKVTMANDWATEWADGLGLRLSEAIALNAELPLTAEDSTQPAAVLSSLNELSVNSITLSSIAVDAGVDPPSGGGFEVRRRDNAFGEGVDGVDLVLRSPVRLFDIPRAAQKEHYYVRMYDASTPRLYSRWSSLLAINVPVA